VVLMRDHHEASALPFFNRVQRAFYAEGRDVTRPEVLAGLAEEFGRGRDDFLAAMADPEASVRAWTDFHVAQRTGVTGFPTVIAGTGGQDGWVLVAQGFRSQDEVLSTVGRWLEDHSRYSLGA